MDHSSVGSWIFPLSVLGTSFLSSGHCAGMCGPLIFTLGSSRPRLMAYHTGRLISYTALGIIAGAFGKSALSLSSHPAISIALILTFACILFFIGFKLYNGQSLHVQFLNGKFWKSTSKLNLPPLFASGLSGLMSIFLPCGHLYTFALAATVAGSALTGGMLMFAFWLGTLPALGFGVYLLRNNLKRLGPNRHRIAAVVLIMSGLVSLANFAFQLYPDSDATKDIPAQKVHHH